jgi:hypothetical protein
MRDESVKATDSDAQSLKSYEYHKPRTPSIAFLIISLFFLGSLSAKADTNRVEGRKDSDDRKLVSAVVESLVSAWNKNDTDTVAKLFLPDGMKILGVPTAPEGSFVFRHRKQQGRWMISRAEFIQTKKE